MHVLTAAGPLPSIDANAPIVILVAAVRYGKHLPEAETFLTRVWRAFLRRRPSRWRRSIWWPASPTANPLQTNQYLRKLIARHRLEPVVAAAFAGRLCYPRYNWFDRQAIRLIMAMSGGNADGRSTIEYTDWRQVDEFVENVTRVIAQRYG